MNKNLVTLDELQKIIKLKKLDKYIKEIGYSKRKDKKYFIKNIDNKIVHFGNINFEDFLIHGDQNRLSNFQDRFRKIYEKNKNNINSPLFYSWNLLWTIPPSNNNNTTKKINFKVDIN
jgi:hypothetical protein